MLDPTLIQDVAHNDQGDSIPVHSFTLDNGMDVVVIPDHRAPVVTHMVWYRNGSADDPLGQSGIAHFLEHLMFKGTNRHPIGEFSQLVASLGGQENAFTSYDYTAYYQRIAREHLHLMMDFEADRMTGLVLDDAVVDPERDVVLEERRMRVETDPGAQLSEAMAAALYVHHPYGIPIIGWMHEIEGLNREHALAYYQRFYTPENAILVIAGDVTGEEVRHLAESTYGRITPRGARPIRARPLEPDPRAARRVAVRDDKVEQPVLQRLYLAPSTLTGQGSAPFALDILAETLGGGQSSILYQTLCLEQGAASHIGAYYMGSAVNDTRFALSAVPRPGLSLDALEEALDKTMRHVMEGNLSDDALDRAKTRLIADAIYARDSQSTLARIFGSSLAVGESLDDIRLWPARIDAVSRDDVIEAARLYLEPRRSVTGQLLPA